MLLLACLVWPAVGLVLSALSAVCVAPSKLFRISATIRRYKQAVSFCPVCFEFVGGFWARGWVFLFVVCVCVCSCFCWSMRLYGSINRGQVFLLYPIPHGVYLSLYRLLYIEPAYLCAVVSKTLVFFDIFPVLSKFYQHISYHILFIRYLYNSGLYFVKYPLIFHMFTFNQD